MSRHQLPGELKARTLITCQLEREPSKPESDGITHRGHHSYTFQDDYLNAFTWTMVLGPFQLFFSGTQALLVIERIFCPLKRQPRLILIL
jgi:hypothetical protein